MADYVMHESFEYTYSAKQQEEIEKIRNKYLPKQESKMDQLRKLDQQAEMPGTIVSILIGTIGTLLFGFGLCCTLLWTDTLLVLGIIIGLLGMAIAGVGYPLYKKITENQRAKIADQIIALTNELSL